MRIFSTILIFLVILSGCSGRQKAEVEPLAKVGSANDSIKQVMDECSRLATLGNDEVSGWKLASPVNTYDEKSIFDYINGAAELYFAYDFSAVAVAEYENGETSIIIDVYDMTTPEGAFGIYSLNRYPEADYVNIGNEGIIAGTALDFWKGRYFCKVYSLDMSEKYQKEIINFGNKLASEIKEAGEEPSLIKRISQSNSIPGTVKFFSRKLGLDNIRYISEEDVFELNAKTKGVIAEYQIGETAKFQFFIIEYPSSEEAGSAFEVYSKYLDERADPDTVSLQVTDGKSNMVKMNGKFTFVKLEGRILLGFWDAEKWEAAESFLQNIDIK